MLSRLIKLLQCEEEKGLNSYFSVVEACLKDKLLLCNWFEESIINYFKESAGKALYGRKFECGS